MDLSYAGAHWRYARDSSANYVLGNILEVLRKQLDLSEDDENFINSLAILDESQAPYIQKRVQHIQSMVISSTESKPFWNDREHDFQMSFIVLVEV